MKQSERPKTRQSRYMQLQIAEGFAPPGKVVERPAAPRALSSVAREAAASDMQAASRRPTVTVCSAVRRLAARSCSQPSASWLHLTCAGQIKHG